MTRRILVVDDQPDLRLLIRLTLRALGEVAQAANAEAALAQLAACKPDLLILDVWLGEGISGLELCRKLKHDPAMAGMKSCCCRPAASKATSPPAWRQGPTTTWSSHSAPKP